MYNGYAFNAAPFAGGGGGVPLVFVEAVRTLALASAADIKVRRYVAAAQALAVTNTAILKATRLGSASGVLMLVATGAVGALRVARFGAIRVLRLATSGALVEHKTASSVVSLTLLHAAAVSKWKAVSLSAAQALTLSYTAHAEDLWTGRAPAERVIVVPEGLRVAVVPAATVVMEV